MLRGIARILTSCRTPKMLVEVGMLKRIPWVVIRFFVDRRTLALYASNGCRPAIVFNSLHYIRPEP